MIRDRQRTVHDGQRDRHEDEIGEQNPKVIRMPAAWPAMPDRLAVKMVQGPGSAALMAVAENNTANMAGSISFPRAALGSDF